MAEKCTNTSSPVERWMNPYPFAPLNHLTVPFSLTAKTPFTIAKNYLRQSRSSPRFAGAPLKEAGRTFGALTSAEKDPKKEKTPQSSRCASAEGTSGVRQF